MEDSEREETVMNNANAINESPSTISDRVTLESLRMCHREELSTFRKAERKFLFDKARYLYDEEKPENLSDADMSNLIKKLQSKGNISCELLNSVMNALFFQKDMISIFLKETGPLQSLIRMLSGQNEKHQLIAAQCICNLALGNEKESLKVLKASSPYLMAHLSGRNYFVKEACVLAVGNFCRHGKKVIEYFWNQRFFPKLLELMNDEHPNVSEAAVTAVGLYLYHGFDIISSNSMERALLKVIPIFKQRYLLTAFLMSVLSSCESIHNHFISNSIHSLSLKCLFVALKENSNEAVFFLRIVCNLIQEKTGQVGLELFQVHCDIIKECVSCILVLENEGLKTECVGLLGILLNHPVETLRIHGINLVKENFVVIEAYFRQSNFSDLLKSEFLNQVNECLNN